MAKTEKKGDDELLRDAMSLFEKARSADSENRDRARDDLRFAFVTGAQWEGENRQDVRGNSQEYELNRVEPLIDQLVGDQRQSRPQIKLRAVEDGDRGLTDVVAGLIRNIEALSDARSVYDQQFVYSVSCGRGNWRVVNEWAGEKTFDQELVVKAIPNPFSVTWDPKASHPTKRDARYCFITEWIPEDEYEAEYPGAEKADFLAIDADHRNEWYNEERGVRIAEYYHRVPAKRELVELTDGTVLFRDEVAEILAKGEVEIAKGNDGKPKARTVKTTKLRWLKMSGVAILESREYDWPFIPVIHCAGKVFNIEGEEVTKGIVRNLRDPQKIYNHAQSKIIEAVLKTPRTPWLVTPAMLKGLQKFWDTAHEKPYPYLAYNVDPEVPGGKPDRQSSDGIPADLVLIARGAAEDLKAVSGKHEASLGEQGPQESGVAINARKIEGDVGSYIYTDHFAKAIQQTGEVLVMMIPTIYDTERVVRVLGEDGAEDFVTINQPDVDGQGDSKMLRGKQLRFDVRADVGPSYTTLREEATANLLQVATAWPEFLQMTADIVVEGLDVPGAGDLKERLRKYVVQRGFSEPTKDEQERGLGQPAPPSPEDQAAQRALVEKVRGLILDNAQKQLDLQGTELENVTKALEDDMLIQEIIELALQNMGMGAQVVQAPRLAQ